MYGDKTKGGILWSLSSLEDFGGTGPVIKRPGIATLEDERLDTMWKGCGDTKRRISKRSFLEEDGSSLVGR